MHQRKAGIQHGAIVVVGLSLKPRFPRLITVPIRRPTADSGLLVQGAIHDLQAIYRPGFNIAKAGVMLLDLQSGDIEQRELDLDSEGRDCGQLMAVMLLLGLFGWVLNGTDLERCRALECCRRRHPSASPNHRVSGL